MDWRHCKGQDRDVRSLCRVMEEIATREGIDNSYVSWMVNLTRLAQDVAILDDALPDRITLFDLAVNLAAAAGRPAFGIPETSRGRKE